MHTTTRPHQRHAQAPPARALLRPQAPCHAGDRIELELYAWNHSAAGSTRQATGMPLECTVERVVWDDWLHPGEWSLQVTFAEELDPQIQHLAARRVPALDLLRIVRAIDPPDDALCPACDGEHLSARHYDACIAPTLPDL